MRILKLIIITIIISIPLFGIVKYVHSKTYGYDTTDCMIQYVNKYYPVGTVYLINNEYPHIDKRGLTYLNKVKDINGCMIIDSFVSFIYNSSYCYITLVIENYILTK